MKVKKKEVTFEQLKLGDVFKSDHGYNRVYIKTNNVFVHTDGTGVKNAVCLNDGEHIRFCHDSVILPVDGEFIYD